MGYAKIRGQLTSRKGCPVNYKAPKDAEKAGAGAASGVIVDEMWVDEPVNTSPPRPRRSTDDWGDYSFCAQLIKWDSGDHTIRLAYYRRRPGEDWWEYASQNTVDSGWRTIKTLLENTSAKSEWFRDDPLYGQ